MLQAEEMAILEAFRPFFEDPDIKKVWHNYSFDRHVMMRMVGGRQALGILSQSCSFLGCSAAKHCRSPGGGTCRGSTARASMQTPCTWRGSGTLLGP